MDLGVPDKWPARSHPKKKFKVDKPHPRAQSFQSALTFSPPLLKYEQITKHYQTSKNMKARDQSRQNKQSGENFLCKKKISQKAGVINIP